MKRTVIFILSLMLGTAGAQFLDYYQPQVFAGAGAGVFRISLENFKSVYTDRWGPILNGHAGVRFFKAYYAMARYQRFEKNGRKGLHEETGYALKDAAWHETQLDFGLRIHPPFVKKANSYYGFGVVFYHIKEQPNLSVFTSHYGPPDSGWGNGFYLEFGLEYCPYPAASLFFETEISSGGLHGRTGFEAFSVGGFCFALGLHVYPF